MSVNEFIKGIENDIFCKESIYRTIIITNDDDEKNIIYDYLHLNDYGVENIEYIDKSFDYNTLDKRIVLLNQNLFQDFIYHLDKRNGGLYSSSYNCIGISFTINDTRVYEMIQDYVEISNNNFVKTIIYDKNYKNTMFIQKRF